VQTDSGCKINDLRKNLLLPPWRRLCICLSFSLFLLQFEWIVTEFFDVMGLGWCLHCWTPFLFILCFFYWTIQFMFNVTMISLEVHL